MDEIIIINGLPGSGKGTQAEILASNRDLVHIGSGQLIRQAINLSDKSDFYQQIRHRYDEGTPQPDEVANRLVEEKIKSIDKHRGIIFDSYPFNLVQAKFLDSISSKYNLPQAVYIFLEINPKEIIQRLSKRKVCSKCGLPVMGNQVDKCQKCSGKLITRSDDKPEVIQKRIENYLPLLAELEGYYQKSGKFYKINGIGPIQEIADRIKRKLDD